MFIECKKLLKQFIDIMENLLKKCAFKSLEFISQQPGPEVIKKNLCSTQLCTKLILLINVEMPTIVGTLTFISMINTTSERLKNLYFVAF